jgi:glycosyltransferase involved in cell wall biosynthesis
MRIGIDISAFSGRRMGVVRYIDKLVNSLQRIDSQNEYLLIFNAFRGAAPDLGKLNKNFRTICRRIPNRLLYKLWSVASRPPVEMLTGPIDVYHAPGFPMPPVGNAAAVLTVHDIAFFTHPELAGPKALIDFASSLRQFLARADMIVTDSKATANELSAHFDLARDRIVTIYLGEPGIAAASHEEVDTVKAKFGIDGDYILFVGCLEPRKNLPRLFQAFEHSNLSNDLNLILAGPQGWGSNGILDAWHKAKCKNKIRWLKSVSDRDLEVLYAGAVFLAFPSLLEGFGLPILEAMSVGCPVLTSNLSSMPEVAGDAALYVDPLTVDSIAEGMKTLAGDSELRRMLSTLGYKRARLFSWENTAREMVKVYGQACVLNKQGTRSAKNQ